MADAVSGRVSPRQRSLNIFSLRDLFLAANRARRLRLFCLFAAEIDLEAGMSLLVRPNFDVVVFDCGGVLVQTSRITSLRAIGWRRVLRQLASSRFRPSKMHTEIFDSLKVLTSGRHDCMSRVSSHSSESGEQSGSLSALAPLDATATSDAVEKVDITDELGTVLPDILCDWMLGTRSCSELLESVNQQLAIASGLSTSKRNFLRSFCACILDPVRFVRTQSIDHRMLSVAQFLKLLGKRVYILSNYNAEAFDMLLRHHPSLFDCLDGFLTSGEVGLAKPDPHIYTALMQKFGLDSCCRILFVDDQQRNREAASCLGWTSIHPVQLKLVKDHRTHVMDVVVSM